MWPRILASSTQPVYQTVAAPFTEWKAVLHADATPSSATCMLFEPRDVEGLCGTGYDGEGKKRAKKVGLKWR